MTAHIPLVSIGGSVRELPSDSNVKFGNLTVDTSGMTSPHTLVVPDKPGTLALTEDAINPLNGEATSLRANSTTDVATLGVELITNGSFTGNAGNWTLGTNWAYGTDNVIVTLDGSAEGALSQNITVESGKSYLISWSQTHSVINNGLIRPSVGSVNGIYGCPTGTGGTIMSQVITASASGSLALEFTVSDLAGTGTVTLDTVTVQEVTPIEPSLSLKDLSGNLKVEFRSAGSFNIGIGLNSLKSNTSGFSNSAYGYLALSLNTTGSSNTAFGSNALRYNTTGNYNIAIGANALRLNTTGSNNTVSGYQSLTFNTTGYSNNAYGYQALYANTTGYSNTANGSSALRFNTFGSNNTAYGANSLYANTTGSANTAIGDNSLVSTTTGYDNTVIGYNSGNGIITGHSNTIIGARITGLPSNLSNNIIISDGAGVVRISCDSTGIVSVPVLSTNGYTVSTLPEGTIGLRSYVSDALTPSYLAVVTGGGAVTCPVFYDGTNWVCA